MSISQFCHISSVSEEFLSHNICHKISESLSIPSLTITKFLELFLNLKALKVRCYIFWFSVQYRLNCVESKIWNVNVPNDSFPVPIEPGTSVMIKPHLILGVKKVVGKPNQIKRLWITTLIRPRSMIRPGSLIRSSGQSHRYGHW